MPTCQEIRVLIPGMRMCGGLFVAIKLAALMDRIIPTHVFTYIDKEAEFPFLNMKQIPEDEDIVWLITWGPHVNHLLERLGDRKVIYYAQSVGWRISIPIGVPIFCVSSFVMSKWMEDAPYNPLYLVEPVLDPNCRNLHLDRDIDVLYISRKSTQYLDKILVPELQKYCKVYVHEQFVPEYTEVLRLYNRSKVYLYSSENPIRYPRGIQWVEGFGLQPLEAMVCGCTVFSNLYGGLSTYLDPAICGHKLGIYSLEYDVNRILRAVHSHTGKNPKSEYLRQRYSIRNFYRRMKIIWPEIEGFFQIKAETSQTIISNLICNHSFSNRLRKSFKNILDRIENWKMQRKDMKTEFK